MNLTKSQIAMVAVLLIGTLLAVLNQTLLTPALPTIMSHLNVSATTAQWLTSGYSLVEAVIIPLNAYLLGRFSTRKLYIGSICLFAAGSVVCACAPSFVFLMAGRIMQAAATGVALPTVFTLILLIFPREKRGAAMGIIGLILSFAPAVGPSISGVLVDTVGWRALFVLVAICAAVIIITAVVVLKNFEGFERTTFDAPSVILAAAGMVCLLYGLSTFSSSDNPAASVVLIVAGIVVIGLFARRQLHLDQPLLAVGVLRHREFRVAVVLIALLEAILIGSGVILPIFVQNGLGETATTSGLLVLPGAIIGAVCGLLAGRLFDRFGIRKVTIPGALILLAGVAGYFSFTAGEALVLIVVFYTIACIGLQSLITPVNAWGINSLPNKSVPHGNAIVSTLEQVGGSFGTAFSVSLSALYPLVTTSTSPQGQTIAGCHVAFAGLLVLACIVGLTIVFATRSRTAKSAASTSRTTEVAAEAGAPGTDRPWLVSDVMNAEADTLGENSTVHDAIEVMQRTETSGLPIVLDNGLVVGFISDGDILKALSQHTYTQADETGYRILSESEEVQVRLAGILEKEALQLATRNVICFEADQDAESAFHVLSERCIKKAPVVSDGKFAGTLSRRNIMKALSAMEGSIAEKH